MGNEDEIQGICMKCGCAWNNPCYHPDYGMCSWVDESETLCSHCSDPNIKDSPETEHCVNTTGKYFCYKTTDYVTKTSLDKELCRFAGIVSNSIVENLEEIRNYIEERLITLNKKNKRCKPAKIWSWNVNKDGEIKCVISSASYKVELCFYPVKRMI